MATVEEHPATNGTATAAGDIAVENPATGEVIAHVPDMTAEQVAELAARGARRAAGMGGAGLRGPRADPAPRAEVARRQLRARHRDDRLRDGQGLRGRAHRRGHVRRQRVRLLGQARALLPGRPAHQERLAAAEGQEARRALPAARPGRRHRPVELPADQLVRRRHPGPGRRQRGHPQAQRGHPADEPAHGRRAARVRAARRRLRGRHRPRAPRARRSSTTST